MNNSFFQTIANRAAVGVLEPEVQVLPPAPVQRDPHGTAIDIQRFLDKLKPLSAAMTDAASLVPYLDVVARPRFTVLENGFIRIDSDEAEPFVLNPQSKAESQLSSRYGLSSTLPEQLRELGALDELGAILGKAARRHDKPILFRLNDAGSFAALSPAYKRMDNRIVLQPILEHLNPDEWAYKTFDAGDPSFSRLELVHRKSARVVGPQGDQLFTALHFSNSEDGSARWRWDLSILRLRCMNGLTAPVFGVQGSYVHRGPRMELGMAGDPSLPEEIQAMLPDQDSILNSAGLAINRIDAAMRKRVGRNPEHLVLGMGQFLGLNIGERNHAMGMVEHKYNGDTLWDYTNAVTEAAKGPNLRRNADLQAKAWSFMVQGLEKQAFLETLASAGREIMDRENRKIR